MNGFLEIPNSAKILVIDDLPNNLRVLANLLKSQGYEVRLAPNPHLAIASITRFQPDLILLDIQMPGLDGYTLCEQLKANPRTRQIPIIFLSALSEGLDKAKAFQVGGVDYITKPFQLEEVLARITNQLQQRFLQQQLQKQAELLHEQNLKLQGEIQERQLLTEKLRTSEGQMRAVFQGMTDLIITIHLENGEIGNLDIVPTGYTNLHESNMDLVSLLIEQFFQSEGEINWLSIIQQAIETQETVHFDTTFNFHQKEIGFAITLSPLHEKAVILVARDITERLQTERQIRLLLATTQAINQADDFRSAISSVLCLVCEQILWDFGEAWIPNSEGTVLEAVFNPCFANSPFQDFYEKSQEFRFSRGVGLPGRIWQSQQPQWLEDCSALSPDFFLRGELATQAGLKAVFGVPILAADQVLAILTFYHCQAMPYQPRLVELVYAVATQLSSLIQRKQAEEALRVAEQRYHDIVENATAGIYQTTREGLYLSANLALAKIYGYPSPEELIRDLKNLETQLYINPQRRSEFIDEIEANNGISNFESLIRRRDGEAIWISENARIVRDTQGNMLYYEGIVYDITERKKAQEALTFQKIQTEQLLLNILPPAIASRLKAGENPIADQFEEVSVIFADLVGFTGFSSQKTPTQIVELLNIIFSKFDQLVQHYGLEKIKTIGDAYMVVGNLTNPQPNHIKNAAKMALEMQTAMVDFNRETGNQFQIRVGMSLGAAVAGVIGQSKFIYDIWGDTVNIASRMESSSLPGKIQVTDSVYQRLKQDFDFEKRGTITIRGKGEMETYWLVS